MADTDTRMVYVNGRVLREAEVTVSIRDMGLVQGDSVFDTARTFYGWTSRSDVSVPGAGPVAA